MFKSLLTIVLFTTLTACYDAALPVPVCPGAADASAPAPVPVPEPEPEPTPEIDAGDVLVDAGTPAVDAGTDAYSGPPEPPLPVSTSYFRLDNLLTYTNAVAACQALDMALARFETRDELERMVQTCVTLPYPPNSPHAAPTCWTDIWLHNGTKNQVYAIDTPGYLKPVSSASLDSWLFHPLCEIRSQVGR